MNADTQINKHFGAEESELTPFQREYTKLMELAKTQDKIGEVCGKNQRTVSLYKKRGYFERGPALRLVAKWPELNINNLMGFV